MALRAQAYAEATIVPPVNRVVVDGVHHKLLQTYSGHARKNHRKLADEFNAAAKEFAAAAAIVDPNTDAIEMVDAPENQRQAWINAPMLAAQPSRSTPALAAAAALGGVDTRRDEAVWPLAVDPAGAHTAVASGKRGPRNGGVPDAGPRSSRAARPFMPVRSIRSAAHTGDPSRSSMCAKAAMDSSPPMRSIPRTR